MACDCLRNFTCPLGLNTSPTPHICTNETMVNNDAKSVDSEANAVVCTTTTALIGHKLMKAQQIMAIEESMDHKECSTYLDTHDIGQGFYNVEL